MVKRVKNSKKKKANSSELHGDTFVTESEPNTKSYEFYHNEIDAFHDKRDKITLEKYTRELGSDESSSEEEVLGLDLIESEESDDETITGYKRNLRQIRETARKYRKADELQKKLDVDDEGWGNKKSHYYGADVSDDDLELEEGDDGEIGAALQEEQEALALQRKMAEQLDDSDFGLDSFVPTKTVQVEEAAVIIQKDVSKLNRKERQELFKKQSPEFTQLRDDFIEKMSLVTDVFVPVQKLVLDGLLPVGIGSRYIETCIQLYLNYCININFYMVLKAKQIPVQIHPVIKRILKYRNMIKILDERYRNSSSELNNILERHGNGESLDCFISTIAPTSKQKKKSKLKEDKEMKHQSPSTSQSSTASSSKADWSRQLETSGEREASLYYKMAHGRMKSNDDWDDESEDENEEMDTSVPQDDADATTTENQAGKRSITYQMAKNKGLAAKKKKKLLGNPRVKHRMKYKKALMKRRTVVREAKLPLRPYGGELTGIRAGLNQSVKLR